VEPRSDFHHGLLSWRARGTSPIIGEIKPSTPAGSDLLRGRTVPQLAAAYEAAGVACLSVVTGRWFGGSPDHLREASRASTLPILRKDFITSAAAIVQSKALGAAAVLLTRKLIAEQTLHQLVAVCLDLALTPFVEIASAGELPRAPLDPRAILAINNRDITVRETDAGTCDRSLQLLAAARASGAGAMVSASGIQSAAEARRLVAAGFDGLLIGTAFLRAPDLTGELRAFRGALLAGGT
jgi:indole-3-glycerol phosphate synthase